MVHFISFLSTMTERAPDSNLWKKKSKNNLITPAIYFFSTVVQKTFHMIGMKLQTLFRRKEKLTNHLTINAGAHQGCWHCPHGHADCGCHSEVGA